MKIALLSDCYWPRVNGVSVSLQSFRDELEKKGHEARIFCPEYPESYGPSPMEPFVCRLPSMASNISKEDRLFRPDAFPFLFEALDSFAPDILHLHSEFTVSVATRLYARNRGIALVVTSHTDYEDYINNYIRHVDPTFLKALARLVMKQLFSSADLVLTPSASMERKLRGYGIEKPIHVLPTGIPEIFAPSPAAEVEAYRARLDARFPAIAGKRLITFAGRVTVEKDVSFLLPVLKRAHEARGDVALLIAGNGPFRPQFEEIAAHGGLSELVACMGYVPREELPLVYGASAVFVFPSKTDTLGLCTIEAMATGLPVVAIGEMGTVDIMGGDNGGFMVRNDVGEFTDAVLKLLGDDALRAAKSEEALAVAARYRIGAITDRLVELYKTVAAPAASREEAER